MANFISIDTPGGPIWVEVADSIDSEAIELVNAPSGIFKKFEDTVVALKKNAQFILNTMVDLQPAEIEASFGIVVGAEAGTPFFGLAKASGEASYTVKLTWKTEHLNTTPQNNRNDPINES